MKEDIAEEQSTRKSKDKKISPIHANKGKRKHKKPQIPNQKNERNKMKTYPIVLEKTSEYTQSTRYSILTKKQNVFECSEQISQL